MKRGDIVIVRERGTMANKARPCLVVQADGYLPARARISLCPISATLQDASLVRVSISPTDSTGLEKFSQVQVDLVTRYKVDSVAQIVGRAPASTMALVDTALRRWLDL